MAEHTEEIRGKSFDDDRTYYLRLLGMEHIEYQLSPNSNLVDKSTSDCPHFENLEPVVQHLAVGFVGQEYSLAFQRITIVPHVHICKLGGFCGLDRLGALFCPRRGKAVAGEHAFNSDAATAQAALQADTVEKFVNKIEEEVV